MSPLATLILASCAIYGYGCIYYTLLATRRRREQEYLAFGLLSGGLGLYAFSELLYVGSETAAEAVRAHRIGSVALLVMAAFLVDFVAALLRKRNRARLVVYLWALSGLVALGAGLLWEPGAPTYGPYLSLLPPIDAPAVRPTAVGLFYLSTGALVPVASGFALVHREEVIGADASWAGDFPVGLSCAVEQSDGWAPTSCASLEPLRFE